MADGTELQTAFKASASVELTTPPPDSESLDPLLNGGKASVGGGLNFGAIDGKGPYFKISGSFDGVGTPEYLQASKYAGLMAAAEAQGADPTTLLDDDWALSTYSLKGGFNWGDWVRVVDFTMNNSVSGYGSGTWGVGAGLSHDWDIDDGRVIELLLNFNPTDMQVRGGFGLDFRKEIYVDASKLATEQGMKASYIYVGGSLLVPAPYDPKNILEANPIYVENGFVEEVFDGVAPKDFHLEATGYFPISIPDVTEIADEAAKKADRFKDAASKLSGKLEELQTKAQGVLQVLEDDFVTNNLFDNPIEELPAKDAPEREKFDKKLADDKKYEKQDVVTLVKLAKEKKDLVDKLAEETKTAVKSGAVELAKFKMEGAKTGLAELVKITTAALDRFRQIAKIAESQNKKDPAGEIEILAKEIDKVILSATVRSMDSHYPASHFWGVTAAWDGIDVGDPSNDSQSASFSLRYSSARSGYYAYEGREYTTWLHSFGVNLSLTSSNATVASPVIRSEPWTHNIDSNTTWQVSADLYLGLPPRLFFQDEVFKKINLTSSLTPELYVKGTLGGASTTESWNEYDDGSLEMRDPSNFPAIEEVPFSLQIGLTGKWGGSSAKKYR